MKSATFLVLGAIFGLLCLAHAAPSKQKRSAASMEDIVKSECANARAQNGGNCEDDSEIDEAVAQFFAKVLEEKAKMEGDEAADMLAESQGFRSAVGKVKNVLSKAKAKLSPKIKEKAKRLFEKVKSKFSPELKEKAKKLFEKVKSKLGPELKEKAKKLFEKVKSKLGPKFNKIKNKVKSLVG